MKFAIASRRLAFSAGPKSHTFYCCSRHRYQLENGTVNDLFFVINSEPVREVYEAEEIRCDGCRVEDGPDD